MNENRSFSILLVDDDALLLRALKRVLATHGYRVTELSDPKAALKTITSSPKTFDLVITDVIMPDLNGRQLAEKIWSQKPEQKILFLSGDTRGVITEQDLAERGWRLLAKPPETAELLAVVRELAQG